MVLAYTIPTIPQAQTFGVLLNGTAYQFSLWYADMPEGGWILDISDSFGNPLVHGIPLVTGADLLAQYDYLGFNFELFVTPADNAAARPGFSDLGVNSQLIAVY